MLVVDYIFKQVAREGLTQKSQKRKDERTSHVAIWGENIRGSKPSECEDLGSVSTIKKRVLTADVCMNTYMCTIMRNTGFSFRQARCQVPKGILKCKQINIEGSRSGAKSVQEKKTGSHNQIQYFKSSTHFSTPGGSNLNKQHFCVKSANLCHVDNCI